MSRTIRTSDGSFTLESHRYGQTYHSVNGAFTEARYVFLNASGAAERICRGEKTRVLEIGFGLGLNALLTADLALRHGTELEYSAFEHDLVHPHVIADMNYQALLHTPELVDSLLRILDTNDLASGATYPLGTNVSLTLHLQDATAVDLAACCGSGFHAIYLDAFSPDCNAECWSPGFIRALTRVMADSAQLSTYSAKGSVRRAMQDAGLSTRKLPGPPGKREILTGKLLELSPTLPR